MNKNLYITDLDGTLLDNNGKLSQAVLNQINTLILGGTQFTIASARGYETIKHILDGVNFNLPIIEFNGGYITDFITGEHLTINNIDQASIKEIYNTINHNQIESLISVFDGNRDDIVYFDLNNEGLKSYVRDREKQYGKKIIRITDLNAILDKTIMSFTVIDEKDKILKLKTQLENKFEHLIIEAWEDMYYKPWYWLSVHGEHSTKGDAIKKLCEIHEIKYKELITFGDNTNDIEMFKISNKSYAVENSVDELKHVAYEVIGSNTDNSVIKKIIELEKGTFI